MANSHVNLLPTVEESNLGQMTVDAIANEIVKTGKERPNKKNCRFTPSERYQIGEYACLHGPLSAVKKFRKSHPHLVFGESTARSFRAKYTKLRQSQGTSKKEITSATRGPKLLLGDLDQKVMNYLVILRRKGGIVSRSIAVAVAKGFISRSDCQMLKSIDLDGTQWAKSLMQRAGWNRRCKTTGKPPLPPGAVEEAGILFHHQIAHLIEKYDIPPSMVINIDQTPMKFAPVQNFTLARKGEEDIPIKGVDYKQAMTATFSITLDGRFLPMQLIYGGKTLRSLPKFKFPSSFALSVNPKHYSNTIETKKLIDEILTPYLEKEREALGLHPDHKGLVVLDVFKGQMNPEARHHFQQENIKIVPVPANMTSKYQPADLTVNSPAKGLMKHKFNNWYSHEIGKALDAGQDYRNIDIQLRLSALKPLHASWMLEMYDYLTSAKGKEIIIKGWEAAGITQAILGGSNSLPSLDPFSEVDPMENDTIVSMEEACHNSFDERDYATCYRSEPNDDETSDDEELFYHETLEEEGDTSRNIFDVIDDELDQQSIEEIDISDGGEHERYESSDDYDLPQQSDGEERADN